MAEIPKFEESLEQLEKLVEELEGGELDLDEALKRFERGVKLSKQLNSSLEDANRKIEETFHQPPQAGKRQDSFRRQDRNSEQPASLQKITTPNFDEKHSPVR